MNLINHNLIIRDTIPDGDSIYRIVSYLSDLSAMRLIGSGITHAGIDHPIVVQATKDTAAFFNLTVEDVLDMWNVYHEVWQAIMNTPSAFISEEYIVNG